ncbi:hydrogenase small subunit [uncultured Mailhella sp.]|uniref:hydrogenase small subunit n=1 Tax=uncultured Mailhella sp. TaxID=1981031 RepID=UPI00262ACA10|nr:hydrogenase small subunit [uncultured Mailhella sp.]
MQISIGLGKESVEERLELHGVSRRDFLKFCSSAAIAMGMGPAFAPAIAKALTAPGRPAVIYLHDAECTGCTEALLRSSKPYIDEIILDTISIDYQETIMAAAGEAAEEALHQAMKNPNGYLCIVEGAIPTAMDGLYGTIGGRTMYEINKEVLPGAKAVIAYGTCASFGGVPAAAPNPTACKGVNDCFADLGIKAINIPGCPPNPLNLIGAIAAILAGTKLELDALNRPRAFFGHTIHEQCERLPHFEAGEFAPSFDSEEARHGWCLYKLGCKGPTTYNNCPKARFNDVSWPVAAGHPCIGCSEPNFWDNMTPFYKN